MYQMAQLGAEVNQLRDANETLSERRRARKTRIPQGGSMNFAENQTIQDHLKQEDHPTVG